MPAMKARATKQEDLSFFIFRCAGSEDRPAGRAAARQAIVRDRAKGVSRAADEVPEVFRSVHVSPKGKAVDTATGQLQAGHGFGKDRSRTPGDLFEHRGDKGLLPETDEVVPPVGRRTDHGAMGVQGGKGLGEDLLAEGRGCHSR